MSADILNLVIICCVYTTKCESEKYVRRSGYVDRLLVVGVNITCLDLSG